VRLKARASLAPSTLIYPNHSLNVVPILDWWLRVRAPIAPLVPLLPQKFYTSVSDIFYHPSKSLTRAFAPTYKLWLGSQGL